MIKHLTLSFAKLVYQLGATALGVIVTPFFIKQQEEFIPSNGTSRILPDGTVNTRFKNKMIDKIFGNSEDGILGDCYWWQKFNNTKPPIFWQWWWVAIRNPIHNLALAMGVNEKIIAHEVVGSNPKAEDRIGNTGYYFSTAIGESGRGYKLLRIAQAYGIRDYGLDVVIGYKNFNINEINKHYKYSFTFAINPFKKFEK